MNDPGPPLFLSTQSTVPLAPVDAGSSWARAPRGVLTETSPLRSQWGVADPDQLGFPFGEVERSAPASTSKPEAIEELEPAGEPSGVSVPARRPPVIEPRQVRTLAAELAARLGAPVRLVITDNSTAMFSARKREGSFHVRANHVFLDAGPRVIDAMTAAIQRKPGARDTLREFLRLHRDSIRPTRRKPMRRLQVRTRGAHHDLAEIFEELERTYFPDVMTGVVITWGPRLSRRRRRRRSIQLGLYIRDEKLIRIHRALDQSWVPLYYIQSVVFHEMLHHCIPPVRRGSQKVVHTPQFRALEKVFRHHREAERWEEEHLQRLLAT